MARHAAMAGRVGPGIVAAWRLLLERATILAVADNCLRAYGLEGARIAGRCLDAAAEHTHAARVGAAMAADAPHFGIE